MSKFNATSLGKYPRVQDTNSSYNTVSKLTLTYPTDKNTSPRATIPGEATNNKIIDIQHHSLDKVRQMATILKGKIDQEQNYHGSWIFTTIKNITQKPVKELRLPVFSFERTKEAALHNSNILPPLMEIWGCNSISKKKLPRLWFRIPLLHQDCKPIQ